MNVLLRPSGPSVPELARAGVRRVSTGSSLARLAYGALAAAATSLADSGTIDPSLPDLDSGLAAKAFTL